MGLDEDEGEHEQRSTQRRIEKNGDGVDAGKQPVPEQGKRHHRLCRSRLDSQEEQ
jgi:hypothetical protein